MMDEVSDIVAAIQTTSLAGRPVSTVEVDNSGNLAFAVALSDEDDHLKIWSELRRLVPDTGRYPQIVWDMFLDLLPMNDDAESMLRRADQIGRPFSELREPEETFQIPIQESQEIAATDRRFGSVPDAILLEQYANVGPEALSHMLWDWERATFSDQVVLERASPDPEPWFTREAFSVLLLPTKDPDAVVAYIGFWPTDDEPDLLAGLINDLRHWRNTFGAELVANFSTMLQFVVADPPGDLDTAYELATQHYGVARVGFQLSGEVIHHYAADLVGMKRWMLHDRP